MIRAMGLTFPNPVGLAAGFDKHGEHIRAMETMGFGFAEIGTVTPLPEPGHNAGVETLVAVVSRPRERGAAARRMVLGISIGTNLATPRERAVEDYLAGLRRVWEYADYVTVNLSAPGVRYLQEAEYAGTLGALLARVKAEQAALGALTGRRVPIAVKIGLDPSATQAPEIVRRVKQYDFDALIAAIGPGDRGAEPGPVEDVATRAHATASVRRLASFLEAAMPLISVGGIVSPEDARERLEAGASLVQLYRGFVSEGPGLIRRMTGFRERAAHPAAARAGKERD